MAKLLALLGFQGPKIWKNSTYSCMVNTLLWTNIYGAAYYRKKLGVAVKIFEDFTRPTMHSKK